MTARVAPLTRAEDRAMLWLEYADKGAADVGLALVQKVPGCEAAVLDREGQVRTWGFKARAPVTRKLVQDLLNGEWFRLADFPGKANPMKVLVYAEANTITKLQALLGEKGYIVEDQLVLPEGFIIPKLFGQCCTCRTRHETTVGRWPLPQLQT